MSKPLLKQFILELGNMIVESGVEELEIVDIFDSSEIEILEPYLCLTKIKRLSIAGWASSRKNLFDLRAILKILPRTCVETIFYGSSVLSSVWWKKVIPQQQTKRLSIECSDWHSELFAQLGEILIESSIAYLELDGRLSDLDKMFSFLPQTVLETLIISAPLPLEKIIELIEALPRTQISSLEANVAGLNTLYDKQRENYDYEIARLIGLLKETLPATQIKKFNLSYFREKPEYDYEAQELFSKHGVNFGYIIW